jgi:hypothetical protein
VSLERDFNKQDGLKQREETKKKLCDHLEINIGTNEEPRMIKIGKTTPIKERNEIVKLLKEYRDILAFSYASSDANMSKTVWFYWAIYASSTIFVNGVSAPLCGLIM